MGNTGAPGWNWLDSAFDCPCGERHVVPVAACHLGPDAPRVMAAFAKERCGGTVLAIADTNTRRAAGDAPFSALRDAGLPLREHVFDADGLQATETRAAQVAELGRDASGYVAVGSGTICDLAKYAASEQDKPCLAYATASSMNGYTSAIAALRVRGLKQTLPCRPALGVFADPEVLAAAPRRMTAAGVADFLSKASSGADWRASHLLHGAHFCPSAGRASEGMQDRILQASKAAGRGDPAAVQLVMEGLLLTGIGMVVAGSSAPASGGEHLISHFLDMKDALDGGGHDLHGAQVGVATIHTLRLWERILALDPESIAPEALADARPSDDSVRESIFATWGDDVGPGVWEQWAAKGRTEQAVLRDLRRFREQLPEMRSSLDADLLPSETVARCIETCGGPTQPGDLEAPAAVFGDALVNARYLRNRYTVLDLAAELGLA